MPVNTAQRQTILFVSRSIFTADYRKEILIFCLIFIYQALHLRSHHYTNQLFRLMTGIGQHTIANIGFLQKDNIDKSHSLRIKAEQIQIAGKFQFWFILQIQVRQILHIRPWQSAFHSLRRTGLRFSKRIFATGMIAVRYRLVIQRAQVAQIITYRIAGSTVTIQEILISPDERQINLRHPHIGATYKFCQRRTSTLVGRSHSHFLQFLLPFNLRIDISQ